MKPHEPLRWRWITGTERKLSRDQRDRKCILWWVMAREKETPDGRRGASWFIEVELFNGQRVFYRAY